MPVCYSHTTNPILPQMDSLVAEVTRSGLPPDATTVYEGRNRIVRSSFQGTDISIKAFRRPNIINRYIYTTFRHSKAERSYRNALQLLSLGFNTPQPIGYGEEHDVLALRRSYYLCRHIEAHDMRYVENQPDAVPLMQALAGEMVRLHHAGVWIMDFSPGNVLYTGDALTGYTFYHVDLNRITFNETGHRRLMSMFATMLCTPDSIATLAGYYAEQMHVDRDKTIREAIDAYRAYCHRIDRRRNFKKLFVWKK